MEIIETSIWGRTTLILVDVVDWDFLARRYVEPKNCWTRVPWDDKIFQKPQHWRLILSTHGTRAGMWLPPNGNYDFEDFKRDLIAWKLSH